MLNPLQIITYISDVSGLVSIVLVVVFMFKSPELMIKAVTKMIKKKKFSGLIDEELLVEKISDFVVKVAKRSMEKMRTDGDGIPRQDVLKIPRSGRVRKENT